MAKVAFSKLNKKVDIEFKVIEFEENKIEVKQYLPIKEKWEMIRTICIDSIEPDTRFFNPISVKIHTDLNVLYYYTNITFTDKQKEDEMKIYDIVCQNGLLDMVYENIPQEELDFITFVTSKTIKSNEDYNFSLMGILENVVSSYGDLDLDAEEIRKKLAEGEGIELLKEILPMINLA